MPINFQRSAAIAASLLSVLVLSSPHIYQVSNSTRHTIAKHEHDHTFESVVEDGLSMLSAIAPNPRLLYVMARTNTGVPESDPDRFIDMSIVVDFPQLRTLVRTNNMPGEPTLWIPFETISYDQFPLYRTGYTWSWGETQISLRRAMQEVREKQEPPWVEINLWWPRQSIFSLHGPSELCFFLIKSHPPDRLVGVVVGQLTGSVQLFDRRIDSKGVMDGMPFNSTEQ